MFIAIHLTDRILVVVIKRDMESDKCGLSVNFNGSALDGAICQYLINCNVINQSAKGWSCSGGALCQPHSSYSSFSLEKAPRKCSNQQKQL